MERRGMNQEAIQRLNRALLLKDLQKYDVCSRARLAELSGLTQATVTYIMKEFLRWGLVYEKGLLDTQKGRRSIGISINPELHRVIGIRLSRKYYKIGVFNLAGELLECSHVSLELSLDINQVIEKICREVNQISSRGGEQNILAVGVALPGPFISKRNEIALLIGAEEWRGVNIKTIFEHELKLPVFLEHDSNAGAFSQMWRLKDEYKSGTLVYYSVGQGIGNGIIIDGQIYHGAMGIAGEIGHTSVDYNGKQCICGNRGCLDLYASSNALLNNINEEYASQGRESITLAQIEPLLKSNDPICVRQFINICHFIGYSIINLINMINPDTVIIGDELPSMAPELMQETVTEVVRKGVLPDVWENLRLKVSTEPKDAILTGAGIVAINHIFEQPEYFFGAPETPSEAKL